MLNDLRFRAVVMLNIIFFILLSVTTSCTDIDINLDNDIHHLQYMDEQLFFMAMWELEIYPSCGDDFDDGDNYPWILDKAYEDFEWIEEEYE